MNYDDLFIEFSNKMVALREEFESKREELDDLENKYAANRAESYVLLARLDKTRGEMNDKSAVMRDLQFEFMNKIAALILQHAETNTQ